CVLFFFFSSRRRHTRSDRDWSSDVCSSDLTRARVVINPTNTRALVFVNGGLSLAAVKLVGEIGLQAGKDQQYVTQFQDFDPKARSEERRVGKEWRCRRSRW